MGWPCFYWRWPCSALYFVWAGANDFEYDGYTAGVAGAALSNLVASIQTLYGLGARHIACFSGDAGIPGTQCGTPDQFLYWDPVHRSAVAHQILGHAAGGARAGVGAHGDAGPGRAWRAAPGTAQGPQRLSQPAVAS